MGTAFAAMPAHAATAATKEVSYLGYHLAVPASWPVIDLTADPTACVEFTQHAVYLGTPGQNENCPAEGAGATTDALIVEPASATAARAATLDLDSKQITSTAAGITVTAKYSSSPALIDSILAGAGLVQPTTATPKATPQTIKPMTATLAASVGSYTGEAFDACAAPSAADMSAWKSSSPYSGIGIYMGGADRYCTQPNLTASWVAQQAAAGWHFIPIWAGPEVVDGQITSPASQGAAQAQDAVASAENLGFGPGTPIYYDMESYASGGSTTTTALTFEAAWTTELHALGFESGYYGSTSSTIDDLVANVGRYTMPDVIDFAAYPGSGNTTSDPSIPATDWDNHQRIHQYVGSHNETWGNETINVDNDDMDIQTSGSEVGTLHLDALVGGVVDDDIRTAGGTWQGWQTWGMPSGTITALSTATLPDGSLHVDIVAGGVLYDDARAADGVWQSQGWASPGQPSGTITAITSTGLPNGSMRIDALAGGILYGDVRNAAGTWSGWTELAQPGGTITELSSAAMPDSSMHLDVVAGGVLKDLFDTAGGVWQSWTTPPQPNGTITELSSAGLADSSLHVDVVAGGTVYDISNAAGAWQSQGWASPGQPAGTIGAIATSGLGDGTMHLDVVAGGVEYDDERAANGTWQAQGWAAPTQPSGSVTALAGVGF